MRWNKRSSIYPTGSTLTLKQAGGDSSKHWIWWNNSSWLTQYDLMLNLKKVYVCMYKNLSWVIANGYTNILAQPSYAYPMQWQLLCISNAKPGSLHSMYIWVIPVAVLCDSCGSHLLPGKQRIKKLKYLFHTFHGSKTAKVFSQAEDGWFRSHICCKWNTIAPMNEPS